MLSTASNCHGRVSIPCDIGIHFLSRRREARRVPFDHNAAFGRLTSVVVSLPGHVARLGSARDDDRRPPNGETTWLICKASRGAHLSDLTRSCFLA